jgi:glycine/D-amino acid oxidase-like deaminating enzyme
MKKRIAVIGAGIYGVTAALYLADKYRVDLIEMQDDILTSASRINQLRPHRGYHYPRSHKTVISSLKSTEIFKNEYPDAIIDSIEKYYCIAKENSLTSANKFISFLEKFSLEFSHKNPGVIDKSTIYLCIKVR